MKLLVTVLALVFSVPLVQAGDGPVALVESDGPVAICTFLPKLSGKNVHASNYAYPDHVIHWWGTLVSFPGIAKPYAAISVARSSDLDRSWKWDGHTISGDSDIIYFNGERYNPTNAIRFRSKYDDELSMWFAWTGPSKLTIRDGTYYFESLEGDELEYHLEYCDQFAKSPNWKNDLVYTRFTPRLRTMSDCRKAWAKWESTNKGVH